MKPELIAIASGVKIDWIEKAKASLEKILALTKCEHAGIGGWTDCVEFTRYGHASPCRPCNGCRIRNLVLETLQ